MEFRVPALPAHQCGQREGNSFKRHELFQEPGTSGSVILPDKPLTRLFNSGLKLFITVYSCLKPNLVRVLLLERLGIFLDNLFFFFDFL